MSITRRPKGATTRIKALQKILKNGRLKSELETNCIQRQINDLDLGHKRGLYWDEDEAVRSIKFFKLLKHWKGRWARKQFKLEAWQEQCVIAPLLGWYREKPRSKEGVRRFNYSGVSIPRKNGKTILAAGLADYGLIADNEEGAEVYSAATKRDQASICFRDGKNILGSQFTSGPFKVEKYKNSLLNPRTQGFFQPLSSDHDGLDGLNTHICIIDELHAHKFRELWDVISTSIGSRSQPIIFWISTAGHNRQSIWYEQYTYCQKLVNPLEDLEDDSYFVYMTTIDEGDDWEDPDVWWKANPNLEISVFKSYLQDQFNKAKESPAFENTFRRLHLNQITEQAIRLLPMHLWDACGKSERACNDEFLWKRKTQHALSYAALDLAKTRDLCAFAKTFPMEGKFYIEAKYFCPSEPASERDEYEQKAYESWVVKDLIIQTPGHSTDYNRIHEEIRVDQQLHEIVQIAFDPYNASHLRSQMLEDGWYEEQLPMFTQNHQNYNEPIKLFIEYLRSGRIVHNNDPVLRWMASNLCANENSSGHLKPDKQNSQGKIDGMVAVLMSFALALQGEHAYQPGTFYENHGMEFIN